MKRQSNEVQRPPLIIKDDMLRPSLIVDPWAVDYDMGKYDGLANDFNCDRNNEPYVLGFIAGAKQRVLSHESKQ